MSEYSVLRQGAPAESVLKKLMTSRTYHCSKYCTKDVYTVCTVCTVQHLELSSFKALRREWDMALTDLTDGSGAPV